MNLQIIEQKYLDRIMCLSIPEYKIFCSLGLGLSLREIAEIKGQRRSPSSITTHVKTSREKLGSKSLDHTKSLATRYLVYKEQNNFIEQDINHPSDLPKRKLIISSVSNNTNS